MSAVISRFGGHRVPLQGVLFFQSIARRKSASFCALHLCAVLRHNDIDLNLSQRQSVTQWDEVRCSLRSLDPGKPSSREDVSLCDLIFCDQIERLVLELNCANGNSSPLAHRFGRDIHHLRATIARNVSEPFHFFIV